MVKTFGCTKQVCIYVYYSCVYPYCVTLIMVTFRHIFINNSQMEHFSAVKFDMGYKKNKSFLMIPKSQTDGEKVEKIRLGSLTTFPEKKKMNILCPFFTCLHRELLSQKYALL